MLEGKKYPHNFRALRIVAEELLRGIIDPAEIETTDDLLNYLLNQLSESKTSIVWINNFLKPLFIAMRFVRAERKCEYLLHLNTMKEMIPFFFAAGHHNCARWGAQYIKQLESLSGEVKQKFLKGEHIVCHKNGLWNSLWTDMMIETTLMKTGKSPGGLKGVTLKPEVVKKWAFSLNTFGLIDRDIEEFFERNGNTVPARTHKEEQPFSIKADNKDRNDIKDIINSLIINPLDKDQISYHKDLINVYTGQLADEKCNLGDAFKLGCQQYDDLLLDLPSGFYNTINHLVKPMTPKFKKKNATHDTGFIDTNLVYSRALVLSQSSSNQFSNLTMEDILSYELCSVPLPLFFSDGSMRVSKDKSK